MTLEKHLLVKCRKCDYVEKGTHTCDARYLSNRANRPITKKFTDFLRHYFPNMFIGGFIGMFGGLFWALVTGSEHVQDGNEIYNVMRFFLGGGFAGGVLVGMFSCTRCMGRIGRTQVVG